MGALYYLKQAVNIALFRKKAIDNIAKDKNATIPAIIILLLSLVFFLVIESINNQYYYQFEELGISFLSFSFILVIAMFSIIGLTHAVAKLFGTKVEFMHFFRTYSFISILTFLDLFKFIPGFIDIATFVVVLWTTILGIVVVKRVYVLDNWRTAGVVFFPVAIFMLLALIIGVVLGVYTAVSNPGLFIDADLGISNPKGTLNYGSIAFGKYYGNGDCLDDKNNPNNIYRPRQQVCLKLTDISGFEKGKDGLNSYDVVYKISDGDGKLIHFSRVVSGDEGHVYLENNVLDGTGAILSLDDIGLGDRVFELIVYDKVSGKLLNVNRTFNNNFKIFEEELTVDDFVIGFVDGGSLDYFSGDSCFPVTEDRVFERTDVICFQPMEIKYFDFGEDSLHWYDMDFKIKDSTGNIVEYHRNIHGDYGHLYLEDGILNIFGTYDYSWAQIHANEYSPGNYTVELRVFDRISDKQIILEKPFIIGEK